MKAAICTRYGPPEVIKIEERLKPVLKDDSVLIRIKATTVSSGDCRVRNLDIPILYKPMMMLIYGISKPRQPIFGTELAGEVESVGKNVSKFKVGDSVFAMTGMKMGSHAEYIVLPESEKSYSSQTI
ncbi:MAG: Alcohol dehydrogenase [Firmicutes bacterium ADurb.Bin146]|jgi:NADPH:quinone reductase-like Zn-dependent oxidoreductase|nr:MAG: Alcohol dehydrogenase [Firmicutes bacterium ADurb.Bin146]